MSVHIPDQDPLVYRACLGIQELNLLNWFAVVEDLAWEYVNSLYPGERPDKILLITGQTMRPGFSICHSSQRSSSCEISVEPGFGVEGMLNVKALLGRELRSASASAGFRTMTHTTEESGNLRMYSVFIEVTESRPQKRIPFEKRLYSRLENMYK